MASVVRTMNAKDLDQVLALAKKFGMKDEKPGNLLNIVYERDGKILAWLGLIERDGELIVAPLVASKKMKGRAIIRLVDFGERLLNAVGAASYIFCVHVRRKEWRGYVERLGIYTQIGATGPHVWYRRTMTNG